MFSSIIWSKKRGTSMDLCRGSDPEGLRILINLANGNQSKFVIKPNFALNQTTYCHKDDHRYCFLKSCHLCGKFLSLDEEVYMYKGELGFCSLECRNRQIYMDEMKEIEISTKKVLESLQRRRHGGGRCDSGKLSEEFRQRRHPFSSENDRVIFL